ncbi:MAG: anaerobic glycerol-3-phosphate dehydrogenase subunit C [Propionibacteriaceae bacterium]|nr:anaerobic glycerol-3-phosphate dehydrogenase subunit C [Propionibacteriaceae bacterium]
MRQVVVVGAGLAGLVAAIKLAQEGMSVHLVHSGLGGIPLGAGCVDVYGYASELVEVPLRQVANAAIPHPYATIGAANVRSSVEYLQTQLAGLLVGEVDHNQMTATAVGALRPTCLAQSSLIAPNTFDDVVIVGFRQLKDFPTALIADNLGASRHLVVDFPAPGTQTESSALHYANAFDDESYRLRFAGLLRPLLEPGEVIGVPAVLGLRERKVLTDLANQFRTQIFEILMPPPSVPGLRLNNALTALAKLAGVRFISGASCCGFQADGSKVLGVEIAVAGRYTFVPADAVILATGGLESQGLIVDSYGKISEPVFNLPVSGAPTADSDFWANQPFLHCGIQVDERMRPVKDDGGYIYSNLYAVGGLLGGANRILEFSGDGIAVGSAWAAATDIVAPGETEVSSSSPLVILREGNRSRRIDTPIKDRHSLSRREGGGARESLDQCIKCTICETQCPVAAVTPLFAGPKYAGPQAERFRHQGSVDVSVDYCSSCGICTLACPQSVQVAALNAQARTRMKAQRIPLRDKLISQTSLMGKLMTPIAPVANRALTNKPIRTVIETTLGIHADAPMPVASGETFSKWWKKRPAVQINNQRGEVVFFHGCAGEYFEVETSKCAVEVLEFLGFKVSVPQQGCCGLALQSNGQYDQASQAVSKLAGQLLHEEALIVSASGSCTGMVKHEAAVVMGVNDPKVEKAGARLRDIMEFLQEFDTDFGLPPFHPINKEVLYHAPCQLKAQGMGTPALQILKLIPGLEVTESGLACCGMAGTYGLKKEKFEIAKAVGAPLFKMAAGHDMVACDTETCRWQIRKGTGTSVEHPILLVHEAFGLASNRFALDNG